MTSLVIKAHLGDDIRRLPIQNDELTCNELILMMGRLFKLNLSPDEEIKIKYKDEGLCTKRIYALDGDYITINEDAELSYAIHDNKMLEIKLLMGDTDTNKHQTASKGSVDISNDIHQLRDQILGLNERIDLLNSNLDKIQALPDAINMKTSASQEFARSKTTNNSIAPANLTKMELNDTVSNQSSTISNPPISHQQQQQQHDVSKLHGSHPAPVKPVNQSPVPTGRPYPGPTPPMPNGMNQQQQSVVGTGLPGGPATIPPGISASGGGPFGLQPPPPQVHQPPTVASQFAPPPASSQQHPASTFSQPPQRSNYPMGLPQPGPNMTPPPPSLQLGGPPPSSTYNRPASSIAGGPSPPGGMPMYQHQPFQPPPSSTTTGAPPMPPAPPSAPGAQTHSMAPGQFQPQQQSSAPFAPPMPAASFAPPGGAPGPMRGPTSGPYQPPQPGVPGGAYPPHGGGAPQPMFAPTYSK